MCWWSLAKSCCWKFNLQLTTVHLLKNREYAVQYSWIFCNWVNLVSPPKVDPVTKIFPHGSYWGNMRMARRSGPRLKTWKSCGSSVAIRVRSKEPTNPPEVNGCGDSTSVMVGSISVTTVPKHGWRTCLIINQCLTWMFTQRYPEMWSIAVLCWFSLCPFGMMTMTVGCAEPPRWFGRTSWLVRSSTWGRECVLETQGAFPKMLIMLVICI